MEHSTAPTHAAAPRPAAHALAVHGGGAERLDGVLEHAIAPALRRAGGDRWSFVRWTGAEGSHVRLAIAGRDRAGTRAIADEIAARLEHAVATSPRESLLPRPASQRDDDPQVGVRELGAAATVGSLDALSSAVALAALPRLSDGRARCAYGLALMAAIAQAAPGAAAGPRPWRAAARALTDDGERGRRVLASLASRAGALRGELVALARELRREPVLGDGVRRLAAGCRELADADAVRRHAHLTCNRLGVTPLEEALLALVLAAESEGGAPARSAVELDGVRDRDGLLDGVSLTVGEGETFVVVGPAGAGKSSLLGIVAGLRVAVAGRAELLGRDPRDARRDDPPAAELVMPDAELAPTATARQTVELRLRAVDADREGAADAVLEAAGLREQAATVVADLDAGQRRRLAIACSLAGDPAVLLLDEPTAGLSAVQRDDVWRVLAARRDRGATTVVASTSLQEALRVGDRAALLAGGELRDAGEPQRLADERFPQRSLYFHVVERPDRTLLAELPDVDGVEIDERADHWAVALSTRQPRELLALLRADPDLPELLHVDEAQLDGPFAASQEG